MKYNVVAAALLGLCVFACKNKEIEPEYMISLDETSFSCKAGADELTVSLTCNGDWTLSTDDDDSWCEASAYKGSGNAEITFTVAPNPETDERIIRYEFKCDDKTADLRISQDGHVYSVSAEPEELIFSAEDESEKEVTVTSSDDWTLEIKDDWCIPSATSGKNGDMVSFSVEDYSETEKERTTAAVFSCGDKTFELNIIQGAKVYSISVEPEELTFSAEDESEKKVTVTSSDEWTLAVKDDWCIPSATSGKNGDIVSFSVTEYLETEENRSTTVTFACGNKTAELEITQAAKVYSIYVSPTKLTFSAEDKTAKDVIVTSSDDWTLEVKDTWCTPSAVSGKNGDRVSFSVNSKALAFRETTAIFNCGNKTAEITVSQDGMDEIVIEPENFLAALMDAGVDADSNGSISGEELVAITTLNIDIQSAGTGQTYKFDILPSLKDLTISVHNENDIIDISHHPAIENIRIEHSVVNMLDASDCYSLINLHTETIMSNTVRIANIDVSNCTALERLYCAHNELTDLDISNCTALAVLSCNWNQFTSLDVSNNTALKSLNCNNNQLTALDVSNCTALAGLSCYGNQLTSLDVSNNTALKSLDCFDNQLTTLDVSNCTALEKLYCYGNQLTSLDVSNFTALEQLFCKGNRLTSLDVKNCTALSFINCDNNQLTILDFSNCVNLSSFACKNNQLIKVILINHQYSQYFDTDNLRSWMVSRNNLVAEYGDIIEYVEYEN